ncbi:GNAT family N-acetyltransferase [Actinokineospora terrae]|uniref:GNAT family N-acetyltransferase n=1 Tax=Actinokineospora terrae TaxID=155974 RepID=UPI001160AA28|nr:GNAT family N-acetyltransferase [Actinokineospora terrae]
MPVLLQTRHVVPAGPFTGLIATDGPAYLSYAVASRPGEEVDDAREVAQGLELLREVFPAGTLRFELISQACPGAAELLQAAGLQVTARLPVMTLVPGQVRVPETEHGVTIEYVSSEAGRVAGARVAGAAFGMPVEVPTGPPPEPADGGSVLATVDGEAAAVASWTQVADGITEVVGVATDERYRRRGLGALVTAHAVRVAAELGGADLTWLTPGGDDADRVYRTVGFTTAANAVHLVEPGA